MFDEFGQLSQVNHDGDLHAAYNARESFELSNDNLLEELRMRASFASPNIQEKVKNFLATFNPQRDGKDQNTWIQDHLKTFEAVYYDMIVNKENSVRGKYYKHFSEDELKEFYYVLFGKKYDAEDLLSDEVEDAKKVREKFDSRDTSTPIQDIIVRANMASFPVESYVYSEVFKNFDGRKIKPLSSNNEIIGRHLEFVKDDFYEIVADPKNPIRLGSYPDFTNEQLMELFYVLYGEEMDTRRLEKLVKENIDSL